MEEEEDSEIPDLGEEGEKENEELCNDGETPVSIPIKKRKRKKGEDTTSEEPNDKTNKTNEERNEQSIEAFIKLKGKIKFLTFSYIYMCLLFFF